MKTKKLSKKLELNKKTIANLKNDEMNGIYGGHWATIPWSDCILCSYPICMTEPNTTD